MLLIESMLLYKKTNKVIGNECQQSQILLCSLQIP